MIKKCLTLALLVFLLGCFTDAGDKNLFETKARIGQIAMREFMDNNKDELKHTEDSFIKDELWWRCLELNNVSYKLEFGLPKTPSETLSDGYADCVNLSILSIWNYGYDNITGWSIMEDSDHNMHQIIIFNGNKIISSRATYYVKNLQEFHEVFDRYRYFNFYTSKFEHEVSSGEVYEQGVLEAMK